ncbi:hypothetical protein [Geminocystis sp. GBBB08]|uniref:hypothetical protein n=1 Tax=Geminocystis sp. GBBB08 TaxID=2604140 RepID=UPI0027E253C7|nr:hypothetical protein [Geminocystis sp. GBBB08]
MDKEYNKEYFAYRGENKFKNFVRHFLNREEKRDILERARVSGAIYWIATR